MSKQAPQFYHVKDGPPPSSPIPPMCALAAASFAALQAVLCAKCAPSASPVAKRTWHPGHVTLRSNGASASCRGRRPLCVARGRSPRPVPRMRPVPPPVPASCSATASIGWGSSVAADAVSLFALLLLPLAPAAELRPLLLLLLLLALLLLPLAPAAELRPLLLLLLPRPADAPLAAAAAGEKCATAAPAIAAFRRCRSCPPRLMPRPTPRACAVVRSTCVSM